jgi:hypothetical protein
MARIELNEIISGLGLLGNVLSMPRQVESQQIGNEQMRSLLAGSGIPEEQIRAATPEPMLRWLSPKQGGFTGKVLGGVGDVGAILSTVVGKPIKAPRVEFSDLAAASRMRSESAKAAAQKNLEAVILDPKSTDKDIGRAAVAAGSIEGGLRYLRGTDSGGYKPPGSVFAARARLARMAPDDPERAALEELIRADEEAARKRREAEDALIRGRQPPYVSPAAGEQQRHEQMIADRKRDAANLGYKEGSPEWKQFVYGTGRVPTPSQVKDPLDPYIRDEMIRRREGAKRPDWVEPTESVVDVARRKLAEDQKGREAAARGEPPPAPPPPPGPKPGTEAYRRKELEEGLAAGLRGTRGVEGGAGTTTTSTPGTTTTTTTQPPAGGDDAAAQAILDSIDVDSLSPEGQAQVPKLLAALAQGMPKWQAANWALSIR